MRLIALFTPVVLFVAVGKYFVKGDLIEAVVYAAWLLLAGLVVFKIVKNN